jgi:hypothetical protein
MRPATPALGGCVQPLLPCHISTDALLRIGRIRIFLSTGIATAVTAEPNELIAAAAQ